ncbi:MAG: hypothetical protein HYV42_04945 [Candidatus Magasanikbacteria bacterium]|nr:hypothetical protein [Candidatus Magasanikbacteria bacterium]
MEKRSGSFVGSLILVWFLCLGGCERAASLPLGQPDLGQPPTGLTCSGFEAGATVALGPAFSVYLAAGESTLLAIREVPVQGGEQGGGGAFNYTVRALNYGGSFAGPEGVLANSEGGFIAATGSSYGGFLVSAYHPDETLTMRAWLGRYHPQGVLQPGSPHWATPAGRPGSLALASTRRGDYAVYSEWNESGYSVESVSYIARDGQPTVTGNVLSYPGGGCNYVYEMAGWGEGVAYAVSREHAEPPGGFDLMLSSHRLDGSLFEILLATDPPGPEETGGGGCYRPFWVYGVYETGDEIIIVWRDWRNNNNTTGPLKVTYVEEADRTPKDVATYELPVGAVAAVPQCGGLAALVVHGGLQPNEHLFLLNRQAQEVSRLPLPGLKTVELTYYQPALVATKEGVALGMLLPGNQTATATTAFFRRR